MEYQDFSPNSETAPISSIELIGDLKAGIVSCQIDVGGQIIGGVDIAYRPKEDQVEIDMVYLEGHWRGRGYEEAMYRKITQVRLLDGRTFSERGLKFVSSYNTDDDADQIWASLAEDGLAKVREDGRYEFVPKPQDSKC